LGKPGGRAKSRCVSSDPGRRWGGTGGWGGLGHPGTGGFSCATTGIAAVDGGVGIVAADRSCGGLKSGIAEVT
jgi:hypothetical protein